MTTAVRRYPSPEGRPLGRPTPSASMRRTAVGGGGGRQTITPSSAKRDGRPFFSLVEPGLNSAIRRGLFRQVRFLAQFGADVNERDEDRRTPLIHCALVADDRWAVGLARLLVEKGASVGCRDRQGLNALHYACLYGRSGLVDIYLRAVDFNLLQVDALGNTPLHYAAATGRTLIVERLVTAAQKYKLCVEMTNNKGANPLAMARAGGHAACARVLEAPGAAGNGTDGPTPNDAVPPPSLPTVRRVGRDESAAVMTTATRSTEEFGRPVRPAPGTARVHVRVAATARRRRPASAHGTPGSGRRSDRRCSRSLERDWRDPHSYAPREQDDGQPLDPEQELLAQPERNADKMYRAASNSELRNRPELVFNMDPIQCFTQQTNAYSSATQPQVTASGQPKSPSQTAGFAGTVVSRSPSPAVGTVSTIARPPTGDRVMIPTSWRCQINKLYGAFEFQFTPSFVAGVKKPPPEVELTVSEDSMSLRPPSALASESLSGSMSDIASVCSRRSGVSRRMSITPGVVNGLVGGAGGCGESRGKRSSMAMKKRSIQALLTLRGDTDASSSDTSVSPRRKNKDGSEGSDSGSSKRGGKPRLGALIEPVSTTKAKTHAQAS